MPEVVSIAEMIEKLKLNIESSYGIGLHGIQSSTLEEKKEIAESIASSGLRINNNWRTVLSTIISLGTKNIYERDFYYSYDNKFERDEQRNVIVAVPLVIENSKGEKIFLGFPDKNRATANNAYSQTCILDRICSSMKQIPPEFVYGSYNIGTMQVEKNPKHYANLSEEERDKLFEKVKERLDDISKTISDAFVNGDVDKLRSLSNVPMAVNALQVLEEQKRNQDQENINGNYGTVSRDSVENNEIASDSVDEVDQSQEPEDTFDVQKLFSEALAKKLLLIQNAIPMNRTLWGKKIDIEKLKANKKEVQETLADFSFEDISSIDNDNVSKVQKAIKLLKQLPNEYSADKLLEESLLEKLNKYMSKNSRQILDEKGMHEIQELFDKVIAVYLLSGKHDVYNRFYKLINQMRAKGFSANVGLSILNYGNALADRMKELNDTSQRNTSAWNLMLEEVLHSYSVAESIGNRKYNSREHLKFEDKLVELGIIERRVEKTEPEPKKGRRILLGKPGGNRSDNGEGKDPKIKEPVFLESALLNKARYQYINTGMVPDGYVLSNGVLMKDTLFKKLIRIIRKTNNKALPEARQSALGEDAMLREAINALLNTGEVRDGYTLEDSGLIRVMNDIELSAEAQRKLEKAISKRENMEKARNEINNRLKNQERGRVSR